MKISTSPIGMAVVTATSGAQLSTFASLWSSGVWKPVIDDLTLGIGMIPRGEVGLIFATIGLGLMLNGRPVINQNIFSALVVRVIFTTLMTPFSLKISLAPHRR